ncbi:hypothetical protein GCM10010468_22990 [Actinocorallia longicatena]|uniref:Uncharacterized protein n=1 Tax=Actinocorallia longicatena TaxID=111803 RepID=A0ABP6QC85_9ACTN
MVLFTSLFARYWILERVFRDACCMPFQTREAGSAATPFASVRRQLLWAVYWRARGAGSVGENQAIPAVMAAMTTREAEISCQRRGAWINALGGEKCP